MDYLNGSMRQLHIKLVGTAGTITAVTSLDYETDFGDTISIGNTVSSYITVKCETPSFSISGIDLTLSIGAPVSDGQITWTKIGIFNVIPEEIENRMGFTTFKAYDRMYSRTRQQYMSQLSYPASMQAVFNEICGKCGLTAPALTVNPTLQNDVLSEYTLRDALGYIAGYQGKNAYIDCDGKLVFRWFVTCGYKATGNMANVPYADERDIKLQTVICSTGDDIIKAGDGTEGLVFNNPLMDQQRLEQIKTLTENFTYRRLEADIPVGNYLIESGDVIKITSSGSELTVPVMSISFHYDGGISCKLSSFGVPDGVTKSISAKKFTDKTRHNSLQKEIVHATDMITGASGGYVRIEFGDDGKTAEILIMDAPDKNDALNVWRWNKEGLGHSHNGYDGPYNDVALTADGHIVAERIAGEKISGVGIETISDTSYMRMERAELRFFARPGGPDASPSLVAGMFAMHDGQTDGTAIIAQRYAWIGLGQDYGSGLFGLDFQYKPYGLYPFEINKDVRLDGTLMIKAEDGGMCNLIDRIIALENRVAALEGAQYFTYEEDG